MSGYLRWSTRVLSIPPIVAGYQLSKRACPDEIEVAHLPSGLAIPLLSGAEVYQRVPVSAGAPLDIKPMAFSITLTNPGEEDYYRLKRLHQFSDSEPFSFFPAIPVEEAWKLPHTGTTFYLARSTPYALVSSSQFAYSGHESSITDGSDASVTVTLDTAANETDITASPGSSGYFLFRYFPLYLCRITQLTESVSEVNEMVLTLQLTEHLPNRSY